MTDVFISYAHEDAAKAQALGRVLENNFKLNTWYDSAILPGQRFPTLIRQQLADARSVVVLWSVKSIESYWVLDEAAFARDAGKLIPAQIDGCTLPIGFASLQTARLSGWSGDAAHPELQRLVSGVQSVTARRGGVKDKFEFENRSLQWQASVNFHWTSAQIILTSDVRQYVIEYRNHLSYEAVYVDGVEVARAGSSTQLASKFTFYLEQLADNVPNNFGMIQT